jgi:putative autotransporter adhesin-like protein
MLIAALLSGASIVQAEKDNDCLTIMSWVNGKFRMFSTECPDNEINKSKKTEVKNVQQGGGWGLFNWYWNRGNNVTITNHTGSNIVIGSGNGYSMVGMSDSVTVSDGNIFNGDATKTINLTGTKKRVPLQDALDTIAMPSSIAHVTVSGKDSYIECDEAVFDSGLKLDVKNGRLEPKLRKNTSIKFKGTRGKPLCTVLARMLNDSLFVESSSTVKVDTPAVKHIQTSGSSDVTTGKTFMDQLRSIKTSGSSNLTIPHLDVKQFNVNTSGSSDVTVKGKVDEQWVNTSGSSDYKASSLESRLTTVNSAGSSDVKLWVTELLKGRASGSSDITYRGGATKNVQKSGSASCKKTGF